MRRFTAVLATMAILFIPLERASARTQTESGQDALSWLASQVDPDGSVAGGFSLIGGSADAIYAVVAGGLDPNAWPAASGPRPIAYLENVADDDDPSGLDDVRDDAALSAKVALAAKLAGKDPRSFGGADLIGFINSYYNSDTGLYRTDLFDQTFAFLALRAAGKEIPPEAVDALLNLQLDGGWEFQSGWGTDTNTTALAVQALLAAQPVTPAQQVAIDGAVASAVGYFQGEQNSDGGFAYQQVFASNFCGGVNPSDANSTAYVIQAIRAAGQDPKSSPWTQVSTNPVGFLLGLQSANGSFSYQDGPDCLNDSGATSQAVPGILERSFLCLLGLLGFSSCPTLASGSTQPSPSISPSGGVSATPTTKASTPVRRRSARGLTPPLSPALESSDATQPSDEVAPTLGPNEPSPSDDGLANPPRADRERDATDEPSALPWVLGFSALGALALAGLYMAGRRGRQEP